MDALRRNWWKLPVIVLAALLTRVALLQLIPLRASGTFELPPSPIAQAVGTVPAAAIVVALTYAVIAAVMTVVAWNLPGGRMERAIACGLPFSLMWLAAVLESVPSLGKPFGPELLFGLTDFIPVWIIGILVGVWTDASPARERSVFRRTGTVGVWIVAASYLAGRYALYALIRVNSGYASRPEATFVWTLAMGLAVGLAYRFLREGIPGNTPIARAVWFGALAFGLYWSLNNLFMPILFDMSFIAFQPTIMNFVYRILVDAAAVFFGVWSAERMPENHPAIRSS